jgi:hypothetical protein
MRYEPQDNGSLYVVSHLDWQLESSGCNLRLNETGNLVMTNSYGKIMFQISPSGIITIDIKECNHAYWVVSMYFREMLGKEMNIRYRRGNYTVSIESEDYYYSSVELGRYRRTDEVTSIAQFDLLLRPICGLRKLPPKPLKDEFGKVIKKTTSTW